MGSKGPAVYLITGNTQYRQAYIYSVGNRYWFGALDALSGMANLLPKETRFTMSDPPKEIYKQQLEHGDVVKIQNWLIAEKARVERAITDYVYKFYKAGTSSL